jgi:hypothetical protein
MYTFSARFWIELEEIWKNAMSYSHEMESSDIGPLFMTLFGFVASKIDSNYERKKKEGNTGPN